MVTHFSELTEKLGVPRAIFFPGKLGGPIGEAGDLDSQVRDLSLCLRAIPRLECGGSAKAGDELESLVA